MRVVRVVQVSVKAPSQTTQLVRRSYQAGLRDGLKYAAVQNKSSLPATHTQSFVSTNTISKTPTRSAHNAAAPATSPSPNPAATQRQQINNDTGDIGNKIASKVSHVHTPTIPLVPKENAISSASVRDAESDWRKVSNSYAPVNNVTSA